MSAKESKLKVNPRVPLGGDYWEVDPGVPLWGFADLHAHLMIHLAFGGTGFWGQPYDLQHTGEEGMKYALGSCAPAHGGFNMNQTYGHRVGGGWPEFIIWPHFTTVGHQQAYIDWIYRAYQGGLRLITFAVVNQQLSASILSSTQPFPYDDKSAIQTQIAGMKEMVANIEAKSGGASRGWLQIAYSPEEAQKIIGDNRLAIILGIEVDSLFNWQRPEDLEKLSQGDLDKARQLIGEELDSLYEMGVRQITPIHMANNAFGGNAIYIQRLEALNKFLTDEEWTLDNGWETGVRYRLDCDGIDAAADPKCKIRGSHINARGLNRYGKILMEEMMARGMIIDMEHMSEKSTDDTVALAEKHGYPVVCSHSWFRDLLYSTGEEFASEVFNRYGTSDVRKVSNEISKRGDQVERVGRLGGIVAPILNQGDIAGLRQCLPELAAKIPRPCAASSTAWAQAYLYSVAKMGGRGVAIGSDLNGYAAFPEPRFGTFAGYSARNDAPRASNRWREIDYQTNGVAYKDPIRDYRWYRFEFTGTGGYDEEECRIWQAIAQYEAGFNPAANSHPATDFPNPSEYKTQEVEKVQFQQSWVDHVNQGLWMADRKTPVSTDELKGWPLEQRAAYLARREFKNKKKTDDSINWKLIVKIKAVLAKWQEMKGDNRPLTRSTAGPRREFDINLDGMAHYGMLPDLLQDLKNMGLTAEDFKPLFRSAYDYTEMWKKCEQIASRINKKKKHRG
jgi:microsomal dipeptidase-like Zn-dependent dipeptidase